jgi:hypothetical protein
MSCSPGSLQNKSRSEKPGQSGLTLPVRLRPGSAFLLCQATFFAAGGVHVPQPSFDLCQRTPIVTPAKM